MELQVEKTEYANLLQERLIRKCRSDPNQFIQYILSWGIANWIQQGELHIRWQNTLSRPDAKRVIMVCPRSHSKTSQLIGRILWELGRNPNLRIKLVCQSDDTAVKRLAAITEHIERNPRMKEIFPEVQPADKGTWSKTKIYVQRHIVSPDPSIEAVGILSTATGGRADILYFDDPVDFRNAIQQPALREVVKSVYNDVWMNIVEVNGRVIYAATPWAKDDLTHKLLENPDYIKILDKIDDNFTPIWAERWNREALIEKYNEIGSRAFGRAYKMEAISDEDALFDEASLNHCEDKNLRYGDLPVGVKPNKVQYYMGVDLGGARTASGSYTVLFTGAVVDGVKIPINITRGRFKSPEFARIFYDLTQQFKYDYILIENNASQEAVVQWVHEIYGRDISMPVMKGYFTGSQKMSENVGLPAMAVEFEQGRWRLPEFHNSVECNCGYCKWVQEMKDFPLGKYSDTVMASWLFREAVRAYIGNVPRITVLSSGEHKRKSFFNNSNKLATITDLTKMLEEDYDD